jgi:anthranilate synthase/aminodeoxychorismate synthase-like glutamine amidotransferase
MTETILVIDNYDSFTFNLVQYLRELGQAVEVRRNDEITPADVKHLDPLALVISPGPKTPREAGACNDVLLELGSVLPTLGVCLGHQCLGYVYGGQVVRAPQVMHGKVSNVFHRGDSVFRGLPSPFSGTRYHSLIVDRDSLPSTLELTAWTEDGIVMGLKHRDHPLAGVQFHPESILTEHGHQLLRNFLDDAHDFRRARRG